MIQHVENKDGKFTQRCACKQLTVSLQVLFVLYEHASGYALFRCREAEDIGAMLPEVQQAVLDLAKFGSLLSLESFAPFKTGANALENINCISEGSCAQCSLAGCLCVLKECVL